jgi:quercetin dioxygenase-like cupin family protein
VIADFLHGMLYDINTLDALENYRAGMHKNSLTQKISYMNGINLLGVVSTHPDQVGASEIYPGVRKKILYEDHVTKSKVLQVEIDAGSTFLELDIHQPGREEVYVIEGVFNDGVYDYPAGSFIHNPKGSAHIPQSKTGCKLLVLFPEG